MVKELGPRSTNGNGKREMLVSKEMLAPIVEIRSVDWEKDAEAIAQLWNNPIIIQHLAGVAPAATDRNIAKFRKDPSKYIPSLKELPEEELKSIAEQIIIATPDEIKSFYAKHPNNEVYVAVGKEKIDCKNVERVIGTVSLKKPVEPGDRMGTVSKLAVSPDAPNAGNSAHGKGIGKKLIAFLNERMFDPKQLGLRGANATIMQRVEGELAPTHLFEDAGYDPTGAVKYHLGWNPDKKIFEERRVAEVQRIPHRSTIIQQ